MHLPHLSLLVKSCIFISSLYATEKLRLDLLHSLLPQTQRNKVRVMAINMLPREEYQTDLRLRGWKNLQECYRQGKSDFASGPVWQDPCLGMKRPHWSTAGVLSEQR